MLFLKGLLLGFSIAAPVGPIGLLCIRRTLQAGFIAGVAGGLGTAFADAFYAAVAAFGLTAVSQFLNGLQEPIRLIGGGFLLWIAFKTYTAPAEDKAAKLSGKSALRGFVTTFFLTLTNPATIISFTAIFAGLGLTAGHGRSDAATLVGGVFSGSLLWWIVLAGSITKARASAFLDNRRLINRIAGLMLGAFGLWSVAGVLT